MSNHVEQQSSWWNKPVIGEESVVESLVSLLNKETVPQDITLNYAHNLEKITALGEQIQKYDKEKFTNQEFVFYVMINLYIKKNLDDYIGLNNSYELLKVAIATQHNFIKIEEIEFRHRGSKQQDFYRHVESLLEKNQPREEFNASIKSKLEEILPDLFTEEGKIALDSYHKALQEISFFDLGLRLLARFKRYEFSNFIILRKLREFITQIISQDLRIMSNLDLIVKSNYDIFERLGKIIEIPEQKNNPKTYSQILQYVALSSKHDLSFIQFQELVNLLIKWQQPYQENALIRETYNPKKYKQPKEFAKEIKGLPIYQKYQEYLGLIQ